MSEQSLPYLTNISHDENARINQEVRVNISGNWPTPNWGHTDTEIEYINKSRTVNVRYLGERKAGMALQVLKPFSDTIILTFPTKGDWTLVVMGRNQKLERSITVSA